MSCYLGIDVGTTKIAAVVIDAATGALIGIASAANDSKLASAAGRSEWDAAVSIRIALDVGRRAVAAAGETAVISAIGVTGQMHGTVLVDQYLRPMSPFIGWQDARCDEDSGNGLSYIEQMVAEAGPGGFGQTGCRPATGFAGATLYWMRCKGRLPGNVVATFLPDLLVASLVGGAPVTDPTNGGSSGLLNLECLDWDHELIERLGLPKSVFPAVQPTGAIVGRLTGDSAIALGLSAGIPVMNALGDNQASFLGSVTDTSTDLLINVGTGAQVAAVADHPVPTGELESRAFVDGAYLLSGNELAGGSAYAALRDFFGRVASECVGFSAVDIGATDFYSVLNRLAASAPNGCDGLRCDVRFAGSRANPTARGAFTGLGFGNFTPEHFARSVLEGLADRFAILYQAMLDAGLKPKSRIVGSGNGIRRNPLLAGIIADRFGMPLVAPQGSEEAACGVALLAARATGELADAAAIGRLISTQSVSAQE